MTNKKLGNDFESEFCEILFDKGFWVHNMAQNASGQPADVIAARNRNTYLIDCKVCTNDGFPFSRIEDNQELSMEHWENCGNGCGWFALKFNNGIYMVGMGSMINCRNRHKRMTVELAEMYGMPLERWFQLCE